jgi:hypothetical protein
VKGKSQIELEEASIEGPEDACYLNLLHENVETGEKEDPSLLVNEYLGQNISLSALI